MAANWSKYRYDEKKEKKKDKPYQEAEEITDEEKKSEDPLPAEAAFDKDRPPIFDKSWNAVFNPKKDDKDTRAWQERDTIFKIKTKPEGREEDRSTRPHYRVVLLKRASDSLEEIMKKTAKEFARDRKKAEKEERAVGRKKGQKKPIVTEPSLAIVGANGEIEGVPVSVEKYLVATKSNSLEELRLKDKNKAPVFEAVYDIDENNTMKYHASWLFKEKEFYIDKDARDKEKDKDKSKEEKEVSKRKEPVKEIAGKIAHTDFEAQDLRIQLMRANDYVLGQDIAAEQATDGRAPVRDTREITSTANIETQTRQQIARAHEADEIRNEDPTIAPERKLADKDKDGIPDIFEYDDKNGNGVEDKYEKWFDDPNREPADDFGGGSIWS